ncbi:MAG: hypothetical protein RUMPE_00894 [Eubacteriales bacterium SKADARSKE-1]|nr:hypothetical protein [Eubacteriales bacterium SKADARSKE-1]
MKLRFKKSIAFLFCLLLFTNFFAKNFCCKAEIEMQVNESVKLVKEKNLFYDFEYKNLYIFAIALQKSNDVNDIFTWSKDENHISKLKKVFNKVYLLSDEKDMSEFLLERGSYDHVFSCNCYHGKEWEQLQDYNSYYHFEDGSYEYNQMNAPNWLCDITKAKKLFMLFPERRFKGLQGIEAEQISREKYLEAINILYEPVSLNKKIIFCLNCPEFNYIKLSKTIINTLKEYKDSVAIKGHPRDSKQYLFPQEFTIINKSLPFESFYYRFDGLLISDLSSCLHTAKFISQNSTVICTAFVGHQPEFLNKWKDYLSMLENLGVLLPKSIEELEAMVSQYMNSIDKN